MSSKRQMNPQPPVSSLTASINSLRPFLSGKYTASFSGFTMPKSGVAETLGASAAEKNRIVQKDAYIIAITHVEFLLLIPIRNYRGARIHHFHSSLRLEPFCEI